MARSLALLAALLLSPARPASAGEFKVGLEVLAESGFAALKGKRVGLITNHTGKDAAGRSNVDLLVAAGVRLEALFAPEHGLDGMAANFQVISSSTLRAGGRDIPVHSLYGGGTAGMRPKPGQLAGLDALVFDIQDVGARFYTYSGLMGMALEEAAGAGVEFVVLDRPNPINGTVVEGPLLRDGFLSRGKIPDLGTSTRHGMTMGELALLHNARVGHPRLTVVRMRGWRRSMWFDRTGFPWTPTSPNMPDLAAATLYPGVACLEFTNLSVGRGTPAPFGWIGAPWLDARALVRRLSRERIPGVAFSVQAWTPAKSAHAGKECRGVRMTVTDREALRSTTLFAHLAAALRDLHPREFELRWLESYYLIGSSRFKELYDAGAPAGEIVRAFEADAREFRAAREPYLLYR